MIAELVEAYEVEAADDAVVEEVVAALVVTDRADEVVVDVDGLVVAALVVADVVDAEAVVPVYVAVVEGDAVAAVVADDVVADVVLVEITVVANDVEEAGWTGRTLVGARRLDAITRMASMASSKPLKFSSLQFRGLP